MTIDRNIWGSHVTNRCTVRDALSRHVSDADESICIGSIQHDATNPFLNIELLVKTALAAGAQAIHPGYGYLSENADFSDRVRKAGLLFVGPTGTAMSTLGDKRSSKAYLRARAPDVPLIPGFEGSSQDVADLEEAAVRMGFPVMLKASAGGGGKGMRVVREQTQLRGELERAQSEAQRSFGSSDVILEKFIEYSKHVEVQIIGDQHGHILPLFERDCSVQRRNQKVIEETPCLYLSQDTKQRMIDAAVRIVKLIGYENAGTVEFVLDTTTMQFYFLEVNTRLQVEHPITEEVVGVDLVALQLYVAAGGRLLDLPQLSSLEPKGHAIECRLCAEDPQCDFFPDHGKILIWRPGSSPDNKANSVVRYETAVRSGATVSIYFDSMICKVIVWAPTRALAINLMIKELSETACIGVKTNQRFLQDCLLHPAFRDPGYKTSFIPAHLSELLGSSSHSGVPARISLLPSVYLRMLRDQATAFRGINRQFRNQRFDPLGSGSEIITLKYASKSPRGTSSDTIRCDVLIRRPSSGAHPSDGSRVYLLPVPIKKDEGTGTSADYDALSQILRRVESLPGPAFTVSNVQLERLDLSSTEQSSSSTLEFCVDGQKVRAYLATSQQERTYEKSGPTQDDKVRILAHIPQLGEWFEFTRYTLLSFFVEQRRSLAAEKGKGSKDIKSPMPCKVLSINVGVGDEVKAGDIVMVVESMKMEITIAAELPGKFQTRWKEGDAVSEGQVLCFVE